jgi:hypothetical protein
MTTPKQPFVMPDHLWPPSNCNRQYETPSNVHGAPFAIPVLNMAVAKAYGPAPLMTGSIFGPARPLLRVYTRR